MRPHKIGIFTFETLIFFANVKLHTWYGFKSQLFYCIFYSGTYPSKWIFNHHTTFKIADDLNAVKGLLIDVPWFSSIQYCSFKTIVLSWLIILDRTYKLTSLDYICNKAIDQSNNMYFTRCILLYCWILQWTRIIKHYLVFSFIKGCCILVKVVL